MAIKWEYCDIFVLEIEPSSSVNTSKTDPEDLSQTWAVRGGIRYWDNVDEVIRFTIQEKIASIRRSFIQKPPENPFSEQNKPNYLKQFVAMLGAEGWELINIDFDELSAFLRREVNGDK